MSTFATQISLVSYSGNIFDQGTEGSCKANQLINAIEMMQLQAGVTYEPLSRQQLYNDTRIAQHSFSYDSGSGVGVAEDISINNGIGLESSFTYGPHNLYVTPNVQVESEAANHKVSSYTDINMYQSPGYLAEDIATYLMQGKPIMVDAYIHTGFGTLNQDRTVPDVGGHAYLIVGVDFSTQTYIIENSWGAQWGNNGMGVMKFSDIGGVAQHDGWTSSDLLHLRVMNGFNGLDVQWTTAKENVATLYAAILDRPGENAGIQYWASTGLSQATIADVFLGTTEGVSKYGSLTNKQFVSEIYQNATGRVADSASVNWFANNLDNGTYSRGFLVYDIIHAVDTGLDTKIANDRLENMECFSMNYGITYHLDSTYLDAGKDALAHITYDANTVQIALVGLQDAIHG